VLQHEIDHLDGVLMLDRASREQRKAALGALREGSSYSPSENHSEDSQEESSG
jgi:peptide deformylase